MKKTTLLKSILIGAIIFFYTSCTIPFTDKFEIVKKDAPYKDKDGKIACFYYAKQLHDDGSRTTNEIVFLGGVEKFNVGDVVALSKQVVSPVESDK